LTNGLSVAADEYGSYNFIDPLTGEIKARLGDLIIYDRTPVNDINEIILRICDANVILTNKTPINKKIIDSCPNIEYIGILATGYNIVDINIAKSKGIIVCNVPAYGTNIVGQYAIALLLEICSHVGHHSDAVRQSKWASCPDYCFWDYPLIELANKTMGIIGLGRIGRVTANIAKAMGMNVIAYDIYKNNEGCVVADYVELNELYLRADVIILHCPLFPETEGLINKNSIAKMKTGVIIINNSRGQLVVEQDLADSLNNGKVYAAAVDVVSSEPIKNDNPLLFAKNCIITPHISWAAFESRKRLLDIAANNLKAFINSKPVNMV